MLEVTCEDCHEVQTVDIFENPSCDACGSQCLTGTVGYDSSELSIP